MGLRVVFLGNDPRSVPSLSALAASRHPVVLAVTRDPRPAGRGRRPRATAVAIAARDLGVPLLEIATVRTGAGLKAIRGAAPDVLAVVAYGEILPVEVLDEPSVAPVNLHFSLLPALRGADPVRHALLGGAERTGVTTMRMDQGLDTGPILLQASEGIRDEDDAGSLGERLAEAGAALLVETLDRLEGGTVAERPQDDAAATLAPRLSADDEWIDWTGSAVEVGRLIRALAPEPGARTRFRGRILKVFQASARPGKGEPGVVARADSSGLVVAAGEGAVELEQVLPEGRRGMSGAEFVRGYRPDIGERLG